jgi:glycosyltransferase involved in cell wall biosynthesis
MLPLVSVVSPVYRTGKILPELTKRLRKVFAEVPFDYEILLVDDGCPENSWFTIDQLADENKRIKGILLSRNFGQHQAITAGLSAAKGDYVIIMDSDLQDDPELIKPLLEEIEKGFDIVYTIRKKRNQAFFRSMVSAFYNYIFRFLSDKNLSIDVGSLLICNRQIVNSFLQIKDKERLYIQLFKWLGYKSTFIVVDHKERHEGSSSYTFSKLFTIALQGLTTHSNKLLRLSIVSGFALSILSFLGILTLIVLYLRIDFLAGWPSLVAIILFSTGLIQISVGIAGIYIGKIFDQVKDRPLFVVRKSINLDAYEPH